MGTMTVGLVIAGIVVVGVVLLAMRWRSASSEQQALRHYQHALDTLRTVSDRMESSRPAIEPKSQVEAPDREQVAARSQRSASQRSAGQRSPAQSGAAQRGAGQSGAGQSGAGQRGGVSWEERSGRQQSRISSRPEPERLEARAGKSDAARETSRRSHVPAGNAALGSSPLREAPARGTRPSEDPTPAQGLELSGRNTNQGQNPDAAHPVIVFEDGPVEGVPDSVAAFSGPTVTRASRLALQRSSRPASRVPAVLGAVLVVVVVAVVAVLAAGIGTHHTTSPTTLVRHHVTTRPNNQTTTTTSGSTTTTAVQTVQPVASTATAQGATYLAPSGKYTVMLTSSGPCWVYATLASTGAVLWTGTLNEGQAQALSASGEIDVQLGHANTMTETLNGTPVEYPSQYQAVFTMKFVPTTT